MLKVLAIFTLSLFILPVQAYPKRTIHRKETTASNQPLRLLPPLPYSKQVAPNLQTEQKRHVDADVKGRRGPREGRL
jgi:hypothetical protein